LDRDVAARETFSGSQFSKIASELLGTSEAITAAAEDSMALDDDDVMNTIHALAGETGLPSLTAEETEEESS
jgi:hypothetical protein